MSNVAIIDRIQDVAQIVRRCPTATLVRAYARAARKLCTESRWYRVNVPGVTVAGQEVYSLGSDPLLEIVGIYAMQGSDPQQNDRVFPIRVGAPETWDPNLAPARPTRYAYMPEGQFALFRVPDRAYNLNVTVQCTPKEGVTQLPEDLLVKWGRAFQAGALDYLLNLPDQPWTNPAIAVQYQREFLAAINNAKADVQRRYQTGSVMAHGRRIF